MPEEGEVVMECGFRDLLVCLSPEVWGPMRKTYTPTYLRFLVAFG